MRVSRILTSLFAADIFKTQNHSILLKKERVAKENVLANW